MWSCYRSTPPEASLRKGVLKICCIFTREHPCRSTISIKLLCNFIEIALRHGCIPVNLLHIFRTSFPKNTSGGVLLLLTHFMLLVSQPDAFWCFRMYPFGKITFRGRPEDVLEKRPDILRTSCYGPICNAKGCIGTGTSLGRTQDVSLTIIHKMAFYGIFAIFLIPFLYQTLHCQSKLKTWDVLYWSYYGSGRLDKSRAIRGRPQNFVCRLGIGRSQWHKMGQYFRLMCNICSF